MAKKKPLKKDRKAGRGNLPAQKQPFYLQAQQQRKPKPKKQREDWDEPAIEPGEYPVSCDRMDEQGSGVVYLEGEKLPVDGLLPGEQAVVEVFGKRNLHARLLQIKKASSKRVKPQCPAFAKCGGCKMQHLQYDSQLEWKQKTVEQLMKRYIDEGAKLYQIVGMVEPWRYRNKCHISFGMNGRRQIISGIYEENSHRVVPVESCLIQDSKADEIARSVRAIMKECKLLPYDEDSETGLLRHLLVRRASRTGEILAALVTTTQQEVDLESWKERLLSLPLNGKFAGILHITNDSMSDAVKCDSSEILYGRDYFYEELLGLKFRISTFSFFQTNTCGAEVLYETAREYVGSLVKEEGKPDSIVYDLYSGTGTIAQLMAPVAKKVIGVEIVEEAVVAARENAKQNGLENCEFIAGDVLKVLDEIEEKPDFIILDPPRDGVHPKALSRIIGYGVEKLVYIAIQTKIKAGYF